MGGGNDKRSRALRGQLMLQIAAGRYFEPGKALNETAHRFTVYSNASVFGEDPVRLPVGTIVGTSEYGPVASALVTVVDRLERDRPDGTPDFLIATSGWELVDDLCYVMSFALNRTFTRDLDLLRHLVTSALIHRPDSVLRLGGEFC